MRLILALLCALLVSEVQAQNVSASAFNPPPKVISLTRDLTVATGAVAYTGCGFRPRALIATGGINASSNFAIHFGMASAAAGSGVGMTGPFAAANAQTIVSGTFLLSSDATGANNQGFAVSSYDADGFTGTWTKAGTPTGTITVYVLCIF